MLDNLLDPLLLARIQFAFTISFHIVFPAMSIGLASYLAVLEGLWLKTGKIVYLNLYKFWIKIFAVSFGLGVVSGVVMSYQFGTNWSIFADRISNVIGPLLGFEVLTAFFLEASFLGIMLFGFNRVSPKMHFAATVIVALGTLLSAFWILAANSWMQTPQGFEVGPDGRLYPLDWLAIVFNPSFPYRLVHMVLAAYLSVALVVGGVAAFYLFTKRHINEAKTMLAMATLMLALAAPLQLLVGDLHGLNTLKHQPMKVAAMEGIWEKTEQPAAFRLFAIPDQKNEKNHYELSIPYASSLILTHSWNGEVKGVKIGARRRQALCRMGFLVIPYYDWLGVVDDRFGAYQRLGLLSQKDFYQPRPAILVDGDDAKRLYRPVGGLVRDRDWSATLHRL